MTSYPEGFEEGCYKDGYSDVCWDVKDYPAEEIQLKLSEYDDRYLNSHIENHHKYSPINITEKPCTLCQTSKTYNVRPLRLDQNGDSCYVVNTEKYQQTVQYNFCAVDADDKKSLCYSVHENLPLNYYRGTCQQKMTSLRLLCYNSNKMDFEVRKLRYPSSCVCVIKKTE